MAEGRGDPGIRGEETGGGQFGRVVDVRTAGHFGAGMAAVGQNEAETGS